MGKQERYYEILRVQPDTPPQEVKKAYQDLIKVWQPEHFPDHPRLQRKAEEKLQKINETYKQLQALRCRAHKHAVRAGDRPQSVNRQFAKPPTRPQLLFPTPLPYPFSPGPVREPHQ